MLEKKREREREEKEKRQAILSDEVTFKSKMGKNKWMDKWMDGWMDGHLYWFCYIITFSLSAKNVYSALFNSNPPERNDFFLPGRMVGHLYYIDNNLFYSHIKGICV